MKHLFALLCVVAYAGHATADNKYQEAVHDLVRLLERDTSQPKGGSSSVNQANDFIDVVLLQRNASTDQRNAWLVSGCSLASPLFQGVQDVHHQP
ncbi:hypothetical protein MRX96_020101 [Rhipicephalus microplus]